MNTAKLNFNEVWNNTVAVFTTVPFKTNVLAAICFVSFLMMSSGPLYDHGPVSYFFPPTSNSTISNFIKNYPNEVTGYMISVPLTMAVASNKKLAYFIATYTMITFLPETTIMYYIIMTVAVFVIVQTTSYTTRLVYVGVIVVSYLAGALVMTTTTVTYATSAVKTKYDYTLGLQSY